jgi:mRNA-degrading endonuclease toxin of MazEF toxin-antitoxin module
MLILPARTSPHRQGVNRTLGSPVYNHPRFPERRFAVVSTPEVATLGTVMLADIDPVAPEGTSVLLALPLTDDDPVTGGDGPPPQPLRRDRLGDCLGHLSPETTDRVDYALRSALDPGH